MQAALRDTVNEASTGGGATCGICLEDSIPQESMHLLACQHEYCGHCLRRHVAVAVEDEKMVPR